MQQMNEVEERILKLNTGKIKTNPPLKKTHSHEYFAQKLHDLRKVSAKARNLNLDTIHFQEELIFTNLWWNHWVEQLQNLKSFQKASFF